jgi:hypothetical protein
MSSAIEARPLAGDRASKVKISHLAGKPAPKEMLVDLVRLECEYFVRRPDLSCPNQMVSFGTSGHRGSSLEGTFTEAHVLAITQSICDYRHRQGTDGPLYIGKDTHALSAPAQRTAIEVLAANNVQTLIQQEDGVTPTPVISRAILAYNRGRKEHLADGIIITPSHNPPEDWACFGLQQVALAEPARTGNWRDTKCAGLRRFETITHKLSTFEDSVHRSRKLFSIGLQQVSGSQAECALHDFGSWLLTQEQNL